MARTTEFKKVHLDYLLEFQSVAKAAEKVGVTRSALFKYVQRAEAAGFVYVRQGKWYRGPSYVSVPEKRVLTEVHDLQLKYPVSKPDAAWVAQAGNVFKRVHDRYGGQTKLIEGMRMAHHEFNDAGWFYAKTTTKSIILVMKEGRPLSAETVEELEAQIFELGIKYKLWLENRFGYTLGNLEDVEFSVSSQHWVSRRFDGLAKRFVDKRVDLAIWIDGKRRTIVDKSKGRYDFEHVDAKHAPLDAKAWDSFGYLIDTGQFDGVKIVDGLSNHEAVLKRVIEAQAGMTSQQAYYAENMVSHVKAVQELGAATRALQAQVAALGQKRKPRAVARRTVAQESLGRYFE